VGADRRLGLPEAMLIEQRIRPADRREPNMCNETNQKQYVAKADWMSCVPARFPNCARNRGVGGADFVIHNCNASFSPKYLG
jgi:hypothetical protein